MKKILQIMALLSAIIILSFSSSYSQSLELIGPENNPDTISSVSASEEVESEPIIKNISNSDLDFRVSITPVHLIDGHKFYMCDMNTCYAPTTEYFVTPDKKENYNFLAVGASSGHSMYIYLSPNGVKGTTELKVRFFNVANAEDYVEYTIKFIVGATDVIETQKIGFRLQSLMPNPANGFITFKFNSTNQTSTNLKVYTESGLLIKSLNIPSQSSSYFMNTKDLINGRYYFMINAGNNKQEHGNFIISR